MSEIIQEILTKMESEPRHKKLWRWWKMKRWIWKSNRYHYKSWIKSKSYRQSYGDCDCFKGLREVDEEHCKTNPKCNLKKIHVGYIDSR